MFCGQWKLTVDLKYIHNFLCVTCVQFFDTQVNKGFVIGLTALEVVVRGLLLNMIFIC